MKKTTWRLPARALLAVSLFASTALGAAADGDEDQDKKEIRAEKIVVRTDVAGCPQIKIRTASGEPVEWIGRSNRGYLGVELTQLTPELRRHFGVPGGAGVMIGRVVEDSPAGAADLRVGDIITRIDGEEITSATGVGRVVREKQGGEAVAVQVWRDGAAKGFDVVLGEQERCAFDLSHLPRINLEELGSRGWEISDEALEALRAVDWSEALEQLKGIDWEKRLEGLRVIDKERIEEQMQRTREQLQRVQQELERQRGRLQRLEHEEREKVERDLERAQRELERAQREREGGDGGPI